MNDPATDLSPAPAAVRPARRSRRKASAAATDTAPVPLLLPADVGIEETGHLRTLLAARLDDADLTLDASQVQRVHTSALQLLLMFCRDRAAAGHRTGWHTPSATLHGAARLLGLVPSLELARELS